MEDPEDDYNYSRTIIDRNCQFGDGDADFLQNQDFVGCYQDNADKGTNPMLILPIIECVYKFLSLEDIKIFRQVCIEWNYSAQLILRKRSKIVLSEKKGSRSDLILSKFNEVFSDSANIPFTTFKLEKGTKWKVNELNNFFIEQKAVKGLELDCIFLVDENEKRINNFSDTPWISRCLATRTSMIYITKLSINGCYEFPMLIPIGILVHVKDVSLEWCYLDIKEPLRIYPINLKLSNVRFCKGENNISDRIRINDIINFSKSKNVELINYSYVTKIIVDVGRNGDVVNLDRFKLLRISVINWRSSNWIVKRLLLSDIPFPGIPGTGMKISELDFRNASINLLYLPQSIEKLSIHRVDKDNCKVFCSQPVYLPNLRYLYINIDDVDARPTVSYFANCPKLDHIHFYGSWIRIGGELRMRLEWNSKCMKTLTLNCGPIVFEETALILDKLILYDFSFDDAKTIFISNLQVNDLILYCISSMDSHDIINDFMRYLNRKRRSVKRIFAGPFIWNKNSSNSESCSVGVNRLSNCDNEETKYYLYENQRGKPISETEFHKVLPNFEEDNDNV